MRFAGFSRNSPKTLRGILQNKTSLEKPEKEKQTRLWSAPDS
jgi:DNA polymerase I-like protein with 3'-5' exonuclease and polymerase domains